MHFHNDVRLLQGLPYPVLIFSVFVAYLLWRYRTFGYTILSWTINAWLQVTNKVPHTERRGEYLPSLPYVWPNGQGDVAKFIHGRENSKTWGQKYGTIYRLWSGTNPEVVLTTAEQVQTVFKDSHNHVKAVNNNSGYMLGRLLGSCLGLISGRDWQLLRNIFQPFFNQSTSKGYLGMIVFQTKVHIDNLLDGRKDKLHSSASIQLDVVADLKLLPFMIIARTIYGDIPSNLSDKLTSLIPLRERVFGYAIGGGVARFGFLSWLNLRPFRELREFKAKWSDLNDEIFTHHSLGSSVNSTGEAPPIVELYKSMQAGAVTREQLLQTIDEILFANIDVTMGAISWCLILLAGFNNAQEALRSEIQRNPSLDTPVTKSWDIHSVASPYLQASRGTYLSAFIHESSRHRPLAAFSIPQAAPTPRILSSYTIPAGVDYIVDSHSLNIRDTAYWGQDSAKFRPGRFLEKWALTQPAHVEDGRKENKQKGGSTDIRYHYWRFGFGPRQCMGKYVVDMIIKVLLVEMVMRFDLRLSDDVNRSKEDVLGDWNRDMETWILHPTRKIELTSRTESR